MKMKQISLYLCCLVMLFVGCKPSHANKATPSTSVQALSVKGTALVNPQGDTVVLRGVSYGWHNWWPRFYNASTVAYFADPWHASVVRAAMGIEPDGGYLQDSARAVNCVQTVVDAAIDNHLYAIIDWHSHHIHLEEAKAFFRQMATRYKGVPNVIYELYNEPVDDTWEAVKAYSIELIRVIRAIDKDALILIGSPHWDQDIHIAADSPITGYSNLMYTLHFYAATHKQELRDRADYALGKGLPLFVSECAGMEASGDGPIDRASWNEWVAWMNYHHLSWAAWSVSDKDETCSMLLPAAASEGGWGDDVIKEWGKIVRSDLSR
ncbi:MAG: glycoside hydrolase family 5 protein [Prevotellaceae bacterium]|jgi:endoglucanase|nr:glycoside hydrolase family 5 protein [Prevotellaceae bacterium]